MTIPSKEREWREWACRKIARLDAECEQLLAQLESLRARKTADGRPRCDCGWLLPHRFECLGHMSILRVECPECGERYLIKSPKEATQ